MRKLNLIGIFVKVVECRSFTIAGQRLGISASGVSKSISHLEKELGVRLVNRTTRKVGLTEEGAGFYERCRHLLGEIEEAELALTQSRTTPRGKLKVQMPVVFGRRVIMPALPTFIERHAGLVVDVELSDRTVDLVDESLDVLVVIGDLHDSRLAARRLCNVHFVTCAAPSYLAKHGEPKTLEELEDHHCLGYVDLKTGHYRDWIFSENGKPAHRRLSGHLNVNNAESLLDACIAGYGIASMASFVAAESIAAGKLQVILKSHIAEGPAISVVYMPGKYLSPKVRVFVDFLRDLVPARPIWDRMLLSAQGRN